jgi:hypothetical protein
VVYVLGYWDGILHHRFMAIMYDFLLNWYMKVGEPLSKILLKDYMFLCTNARKIKFESNFYELVTCVQVWDHFFFYMKRHKIGKNIFLRREQQLTVKQKVKLSAVESYRVVRCEGSHII